ncbi:MAG: Cna B-type domain-containing protein [Ndongobacter sp.]|nr:Cna B-type domain-containing protein [Ndongobacter sp.]
MKRKGTGRLLSLLMAFSMLAAMIPMTTFAEESGSGEAVVAEQPYAQDPSSASESEEKQAETDREVSEAEEAKESLPQAETGEKAEESLPQAETEEKAEEGLSQTGAGEEAEEGSSHTPNEPAKESVKEGSSAASESSSASARRVPRGPVTEIYLDGQNGDDSKDGTTKENAVKTFAKAKELAAANQDIVTIWVMGTVSVSGEISLSGTNAILKREKDFPDYLIQIRDAATMNGITVDGNQENARASKSLILVIGTVTIEDGTVLQNNRLTDLGYFDALGGGMIIEDGTVNMTGGVITNNTANFGGGVFVHRGTFNFQGGSIENNHAVNGTEAGQHGYAAGGGVCVYDGGTLNLSGSAVLQNNDSKEVGGGISVGVGVASNGSDRLNMTGGIVTNNTAGSGGGGIFVQAGFEGKQGVAVVSAGEITNNKMTAEGEGSNAFGGAGIYVNGYPNTYTGFQNGELHLTDALITENKAALQGGGYAGCPSSQTHIFVNDGAAFYGNEASGGREIYILASNAYGSHSGDPKYMIANTMLGAVPYNWKYDDGTEVDLSKLEGQLLAAEEESLSLNTDAVGNADTLARAKVRITGNVSNTRGGGIGTNGTVFIGTEEKTSVPVEKKWDDNNAQRPDAVQIELYRSGTNEGETYIGYQTIRADANGNWSAVFENLLKFDLAGNPYKYTLKERSVAGYTSKTSGTQEDGFVITNTASVSIPVNKVWVGEKGTAVTIRLFADREDTGKSVVLTEDNRWYSAFEGLPKYREDGAEIVYTVTEDEVAGYTSEISGSAAEGFTVRNTITGKVSVPVTKKWIGTPADSITIYLYADGVKVDTQKISEKNHWQHTFADLEQYRDGKEIRYTVEEEKIEGYTTAIAGDAKSGYVITNTKNTTPPKTTVTTPPKTGDDAPIGLWTGFFAVSFFAILLAVKYRKKLQSE